MLGYEPSCSCIIVVDSYSLDLKVAIAHSHLQGETPRSSKSPSALWTMLLVSIVGAQGRDHRFDWSGYSFLKISGTTTTGPNADVVLSVEMV